MRIAITGATGFIGRHLAKALARRGDHLVTLGRKQLQQGVDHVAASIADCDAVINLAGAPINKRWTERYKKEIVASRVDTTQLLVQAMRQLEQRPATFISTSAIGAFDTLGRYTEADKPNANDFLGRLARDWESAASTAEELGVRTLIMRFGLVLGHDGGMLKQLLLPFRLGLGGPVGDGSQHFSWIHIDDLINAQLHALDTPTMAGVYHLCAPHPATNLEFTHTLGNVLQRPTLLRVPAFALRIAFGEGADVMTSGQCVVSTRLDESGFDFRYPRLREALVAIVQRSKTACPTTGMLGSGAGSSPR